MRVALRCGTRISASSRFGSPIALRVTIEVPEDIRRTPVPPLLLRPIVENAIKHAVAPLTGPAFIVVTARRIGDRIRIEVADSGRGFDYQAGARRGRGLELAERRLKAHAASGELHAERGGAAFTVVLTLPA
jgi:LytS/YehU family sensor histidine kinase